MDNMDFDDDAVDVAIQLVVDVDNALDAYELADGSKLSDDKRREYLPLVLDLLHRSNARDDARLARRVQALAAGAEIDQKDCGL